MIAAKHMYCASPFKKKNIAVLWRLYVQSDEVYSLMEFMS